MSVHALARRQIWQKTADDSRKARDEKRKAAHQPRRDVAWERVRQEHLTRYPLCRMPGCRTPGDHPDADHILGAQEAPNRRLDPTNLQTLCLSCQSARSCRDHFSTVLGPRRP
ncbi:hypothetical protein AA13594_1994 [Gluconacetobacter azotocaptans DSM 13594]|nr:hypothetical protein AA13594_1994 [Gluconacetobacter azotocaptans DSM 13594]